MANQSGSYSSGQLTTILNEINNDPLALGISAYLTNGDMGNVCKVLNFFRDGATPCPNNGIVGPNGTITGATNATPIVITTGAPHGLSTGDWVIIAGVLGNLAANGQNAYYGNTPSFTAPAYAQGAQQITVLSTTTFSLTGSVGGGAYTSGGTWAKCLPTISAGTKPNVVNESVSVASVLANIAPADAGAAISTTQQTLLAAILNPQGNVLLVDANGNELNGATWLQSLTIAGTTSRKAVKALETRFASRIENLLNLINFINPGVLVAPVDIVAAQAGHY